MIHINYLLIQRIENAQNGLRRVINPLKKGTKPEACQQQSAGISLHARKRRRVECRSRGTPNVSGVRIINNTSFASST